MPEGNGQIETVNAQSTAYTGYPDQEDLELINHSMRLSPFTIMKFPDAHR